MKIDRWALSALGPALFFARAVFSIGIASTGEKMPIGAQMPEIVASSLAKETVTKPVEWAKEHVERQISEVSSIHSPEVRCAELTRSVSRRSSPRWDSRALPGGSFRSP